MGHIAVAYGCFFLHSARVSDRGEEIRILARVARECGIARVRVGDLEIELGAPPAAAAEPVEPEPGVYARRRDEILFASAAGRRARLPVG